MRRALLLAVLLSASSLAVASRPQPVWGPPPDWARYKTLGDAAVRAKLPSGSWQIEWPYGYVKTGWRHRGHFIGYLTCGRLRADRPVPGFHPLTQFVIVIDNDRVQTVDISTRESNSLVNIICEKLVARGYLPPAQVAEQPREIVVASIGMTVRAMPEGAYVVSVLPKGTAAHAGIAAGTVLTKANGIALAGMGQAMTAVLSSDVAQLSLETAAGQHFDLRR